MTKKIILAIVLMFVVMGGTIFWIFNTFNQSNVETNSRTEADFTTQRFVINQLWEMQKKQDNQVITSYVFIKVNNEPISLRLPLEVPGSNQDPLIEHLAKGDQIEVKVLRSQLDNARKNGVFKTISRFIMGDKREVAVYKLTVNNKLLVDRDIHSWNEAEITLLSRILNNPFILLVPAFIVMYIIGYARRKKLKQQQNGKVLSN